jgi:hypothetical protein
VDGRDQRGHDNLPAIRGSALQEWRSAKLKSLLEDVEQSAGGSFIELKGLALFTGNLSLVSTVAIDLNKPSTVSLERRISRADFIVNRIAIHRFVLD